MTLDRKNIIIILMSLALCGLCVFTGVQTFQQIQKEKQRVELQNQLAEKDKTLEIKEGLYTKLSLQSKEIISLLDTKNQQLNDLKKILSKKDSDILAANSIIVGLKKQIESFDSGSSTTSSEHGDGDKKQIKVDFHHDMGIVKIDGWTLTPTKEKPPQSWVRLSPGRPLKMSIVVTQEKDKSWRSYATVDDPNFSVDIAVAAVNPSMLSPKWYEGIGVNVDLGIGVNSSGIGALVGVGLGYRIKQFTVGPHVWLGLNDKVDKYAGVSFEWRPFQKDR